MTQLNQSLKKQERLRQLKGVLGMIHLLAGGSLLVKGIIVAMAMLIGGVAYYNGDKEVEKVAEEVIEYETGIPLLEMQPQECDKTKTLPKQKHKKPTKKLLDDKRKSNDKASS